jgi:hypothetical protein
MLTSLPADEPRAVGVACFRTGAARLGLLPLAPYHGVDVRTIVQADDGSTGLFVFSFHVTRAGRAISLARVPTRRARIHVELGKVDVADAGVVVGYGIRAAPELGKHEPLLGSHDTLFWLRDDVLHRAGGAYRDTT